jgi:hypothetical protein
LFLWLFPFSVLASCPLYPAYHLPCVSAAETDKQGSAKHDRFGSFEPSFLFVFGEIYRHINTEKLNFFCRKFDIIGVGVYTGKER